MLLLGKIITVPLRSDRKFLAVRIDWGGWSGRAYTDSPGTDYTFWKLILYKVTFFKLSCFPSKTPPLPPLVHSITGFLCCSPGVFIKFHYSLIRCATPQVASEFYSFNKVWLSMQVSGAILFCLSAVCFLASGMHGLQEVHHQSWPDAWWGGSTAR